jgi:lysozyme
MIDKHIVFRELAKEEGIRYSIYKCTAGHDTIGIGHNLDVENVDDIIGRKITKTIKLTSSEVEKIFFHDLDQVINDLNKNISWWSSLPDFAQYVLISLCFNLGIGGKISNNPIRYNGLLGFQNTLTAFKNQQWESVATNLEKSKWCSQVGNRCKKLTNILRTQQIH